MLILMVTIFDQSKTIGPLRLLAGISFSNLLDDGDLLHGRILF